MTHYKKPTAWMCLLAQTLFLFLVPAARAGSGTDDPAPHVPTRPFLSDAGADSTRWAPETKSSRRKWGLIGAGTGLVAGVAMAIWVKSEADDRYDIYLNTADPGRGPEGLRRGPALRPGHPGGMGTGPDLLRGLRLLPDPRERAAPGSRPG